MGRKAKFALAAAGLLIGAAVGYFLFAPGTSSVGERVNAAIDDLQAVGVRLLDLPLFMLLAGAALLVGTAVVVLEKLAFGKVAFRRALAATLCLALLAAIAIVADRRITMLEKDRNDARDELRSSRMTALNPAPVTTGPALGDAVAAKPTLDGVAKKRDTFLFDRNTARFSLSANFSTPVLHPIIYDRAIDIVKVNAEAPLTVAYLAIVDLTLPGVQIKLNGNFAAKTLMSDFVRRDHVSLAINGEAGVAPQANAGLGTWTGHFIVEGKPILKELTGNPRPFLSFDQKQHATFIAQAAKNRTTPPSAYNVIWGRIDAIIDGTVQTDPERNRQPRTAMGINKEGTKLYLLVVDGRQQRYSIGFTRAEVGHFLKAFGAYNGMLCDEGGSSQMYTSTWGMVNSPSDGEERAIYSHFGVITPKN